MNDLPKKILDYKTYNKIGHFSKSRLGDGDHFIDKKTESQFLTKCDDQTAVIIVQEKLDGSNVCVVNIKNKMVALSRAGYLCETSNQLQHRAFAKWVKIHEERFINCLFHDGMRLVGEW